MEYLLALTLGVLVGVGISTIVFMSQPMLTPEQIDACDISSAPNCPVCQVCEVCERSNCHFNQEKNTLYIEDGLVNRSNMTFKVTTLTPKNDTT